MLLTLSVYVSSSGVWAPNDLPGVDSRSHAVADVWLSQRAECGSQTLTCPVQSVGFFRSPVFGQPPSAL